jgi:muramoyltetrapeptide carboxypeptidase
MVDLIKPRRLRTGDTIGIVSPAAPLAGLVPHRVDKGVKALKDMGFKVRLGANSLKVSGKMAGSPEERADDLNHFFADSDIAAIFSFIGGNHSRQLLDYLDFDNIRKNPKIFLGYSDPTVLHLAFHTRVGLVSFYGPAVLTQFAENPSNFPYTKSYFERSLTSTEPIGKITPSEQWTDEVLDWFQKKDLERARKMKKNKGWEWLKGGSAEGPILGGCLTTMLELKDGDFWPELTGRIFFWETSEDSDDFTAGERPELISAELAYLRKSGVFGKIKGMVVGGPFGYTDKAMDLLKKVILKNTDGFNFPILFSVDIGHTDPMITVPLGVKTTLDSRGDVFSITESGVI